MYHSEQPNASGTSVLCWLLFLYPKTNRMQLHTVKRKDDAYENRKTPKWFLPD
nr:MAG TPA: hypothetical protein [Caudoviricetes sp.]